MTAHDRLTQVALAAVWCGSLFALGAAAFVWLTRGVVAKEAIQAAAWAFAISLPVHVQHRKNLAARNDG